MLTSQPEKKASYGRQTKKKTPLTSFDARKGSHLLQVIDLCGYRERKFSKIGLRMLVDSIQEMPCLTTLLLRHNGIDDSYRDELISLFSNRTICKVDLSNNQVESSTMIALGQHLLDNQLSHLRWLDMSRNSYSSNKSVT